MKTLAILAAGAAFAVGGFAVVPQTAEAQSRAAPRGSYAQSCSGAYVNQGRLYADCRDRTGNTRPTSIELAPCSSSDIGNDNGLLVCQGVRGEYERGNNGGGNNNGGGWGGNNNNGGGWGGNNGGGGWGGNNGGGGWGGNNGGGGNTVTVYRDAGFSGPSQTFRGEVHNLINSGVNDAISSMEFRGEWEACTDAGFRGQCQVFSDNVRNLDRWGMNDSISSLRPLRRGNRW